MSDFPKRITIVEEGPREGFQSEPPGIATQDKVRLIEALAKTGLTEIACCSFVDARRMPQMADAEAIARSIQRRPGVRYTGLWLNERGFDRARATSLDLKGVVVASASATFLARNNNRTPAQSLRDQAHMLTRYREAAVALAAGYVFTAFGCNYEGDIAPAAVVDTVSDLVGICRKVNADLPLIYLCDTVGFANPVLVKRVVGAVRDRFPDLPIGLHLHDTRGTGLANAIAGLQLGVERFDASIAGLGGCPFAGNKGAAGNIATEDLAFCCEEMGIATGLDLEDLLDCARLAETIVGHDLPGKTKRAGSLQVFRNASKAAGSSAAGATS